MKQTTLFNVAEELATGASFNADRSERYWLYRCWSSALPVVTVIGLNPSTANENTDDPTINSITRILKHNNYGGFYMTNLYTMVTPYPKELIRDLNEKAAFFHITDRVVLCFDVIFAWGAFKAAESRAWIAQKKYPGALCFGQNKDGSPKHPLYLRADTKLVPYKFS